MLVSIAVAVAIAAVTLTALKHRATPQASGSASAGLSAVSREPILGRHDAWVWGYLGQAQRANNRRDPACSPTRVSSVRGAVFSLGRPDAALMAAFAVLDHPRTQEDAIPGGLKHGIGGVRGIFVRYIRRSQYRFGGGYYLIPAAHIAQQQGPPTRCYSEDLRALRAQLPQHPAAAAAHRDPRRITDPRLAALPTNPSGRVLSASHQQPGWR